MTDRVKRDRLGMKMICAWNGVDKLPETHHAHTNSSTAEAWERVAKAVLDDMRAWAKEQTYGQFEFVSWLDAYEKDRK